MTEMIESKQRKILRRDAKNTWKNYTKKDLNEPVNHNGVVSHPEPELQEYDVMWALGSTVVNKANVCNEIPIEFSKTLKYDAIKVLHSQYVHKSGKPSSGHGTGKGQSSSQFLRRVVLKNVQTI